MLAALGKPAVAEDRSSRTGPATTGATCSTAAGSATSWAGRRRPPLGRRAWPTPSPGTPSAGTGGSRWWGGHRWPRRPGAQARTIPTDGWAALAGAPDDQTSTRDERAQASELTQRHECHRRHRNRLRRPHHRRLPRPPRPHGRLRRRGAREGRAPQPGQGADLRGRASTSSCARASTAAASRSCSAPTHAVDRRRVRLPLRADARRATTARPTSPTSARRRPRSARTLEPECDRHQQVDGAGGLDPGGRAGPRPRRRVRRVEPRVPPRGLGRARLPQPRPHRHRQRRPGRRHAGGGAVRDRCEAPLVITDPASAETIKYASNAFLATKVSFVNALANVCEAVGADVREVVLGMGYDKRIGFEFLKPGPGWGGSLLPEGHPGPGPHRRGRRLRLRPAPGRHRRQRRAVRAHGHQGRAGRRRLARGQDRRGVGPHASRPAPTTCATRPPSRSSAGSQARGATVRAYDPAIKPGTARRPSRASTSCADPYAAVRGRRRARRAHRVGRVPLARLRQGRRR